MKKLFKGFLVVLIFAILAILIVHFAIKLIENLKFKHIIDQKELIDKVIIQTQNQKIEYSDDLSIYTEIIFSSILYDLNQDSLNSLTESDSSLMKIDYYINGKLLLSVNLYQSESLPLHTPHDQNVIIAVSGEHYWFLSEQDSSNLLTQQICSITN